VQDRTVPKHGAAETGQGKRALVVGCGFIGSRITRELLADGELPTVLTRSTPADDIVAALPPERLLIGDASDEEQVRRAIENVDRVIYTAGGLLPAASEREPERDEELTLAPLRTILKALRDRPDISLLYLSSGGTVYGDPERIPVPEDEEPNPRGVYGKLHLLCEREILQAAEASLEARVLRCSTVYGEGQQPDRGQGVIVTFLSHIERGLPIELFGDGGTVRDYIYVGDLARIVIDLLAVAGGPSVLNVGSGKGTSLVEIVRLTETVVGREAEIVNHPERPFDVHQIVLDIERLRALVTPPDTPIDEGVRRTGQWLAALGAEAS
jgi:UDP-glucose 4-epimerase